MEASRPLTLRKEERMTSRKLMEKLFNGGGSRAMTSFPVRMVYMIVERESEHDPQAQVMVCLLYTSDAADEL